MLIKRLNRRHFHLRVYLTSNTGQRASSATLSLTLPRKNSLMPPVPRFPITIRSNFPSFAISTILSAGLPLTSFVEMLMLGLVYFAFLKTSASIPKPELITPIAGYMPLSLSSFFEYVEKVVAKLHLSLIHI